MVNSDVTPCSGAAIWRRKASWRLRAPARIYAPPVGHRQQLPNWKKNLQQSKDWSGKGRMSENTSISLSNHIFLIIDPYFCIFTWWSIRIAQYHMPDMHVKHLWLDESRISRKICCLYRLLVNVYPSCVLFVCFLFSFASLGLNKY